MFSKIASCAAAALVIAAVAAPAHAGMFPNGISLNGLAANGFTTNGMSINGFTTNGTFLNGFTTNGTFLNGLAPNGTTVGTAAFAIDGIELPASLR